MKGIVFSLTFICLVGAGALFGIKLTNDHLAREERKLTILIQKMADSKEVNQIFEGYVKEKNDVKKRAPASIAKIPDVKLKIEKERTLKDLFSDKSLKQFELVEGISKVFKKDEMAIDDFYILLDEYGDELSLNKKMALLELATKFDRHKDRVVEICLDDLYSLVDERDFSKSMGLYKFILQHAVEEGSVHTATALIQESEMDDSQKKLAKLYLKTLRRK